ncbi:MAG TPA: hypothetical protein VFT95_18590 [Micromonosporaceae bacterium]|nr:hypothetical protein [Micromonosporaceae bacterium]
MTNFLTPPPERRLPAARVAELRARVMAGIDQPAHPVGPARRVMLVTAAAAAVVAGGVTAASVIPGDDAVQVLAFGPGALSPKLAAGVDKCLRYNSPESKDPSSLALDPRLPVTKDDLVVGVQHGDTSAVAFVTDEGYLACQYDDRGEGSGGTTVDRWQPHRKEWLPGPVDRLLVMSSDLDGGDVTVIGRVSADVHRLVLEYGNGHSSEARFGSGMFALLSDGTRVAGNAALVSYDADGREIGRTPLFDKRDRDACFTDPAGNVVYGEPGNGCRPAFRWR